jgi:hypothetical protein
MNTTAAGVCFDARSEYNHQSPIEAATVCRERILAALMTMGARTAVHQ